MAFAKGNESKEAAGIKHYIGTHPVKILAVNPTKEELSKIYGHEVTAEQNYVTEVVRNGKHVRNARITFVVQTAEAPNREPVANIISTITFYILDEYNTNRDNTKVQGLDKYGRSAWVTIEEGKNHMIPVYKNGPARIDKDYHAAKVGEEALVVFLKKYLNIEEVEYYNKSTNSYITNKNPEKCEASLSEINKYFEGDFTELKNIIQYRPDNMIRVAFGVRKADDGRMFQTVYPKVVNKLNNTNYSKMDASIKQDKNNGGLKNIEFSVDPLHEYDVEATDFNSEPKQADNPFTAAPADNPFA